MKIPDWLPCYGDTTYRGICPHETTEQHHCFKWLRTQYPQSWGMIAMHPKNEAKRTHGQMWYDRNQGLCKGASDIIIPGSPTFVCELKRKDHTMCIWQEGQLDYLLTCRQNGAFVCVALGCDGFMEAFGFYLRTYYAYEKP